MHVPTDEASPIGLRQARLEATVAGGREFDQSKLEELIVYIAHRLGPEAALGRVKLAKLLMHSDFEAYRRRGVSITGARYEKWEHGHLPHELKNAQLDLEASGAIAIEQVDYYGKPLKHITALRDPRLASFDEDEVAVVEGAIRLYGHESAKYLSELSHQELGWRLAGDREEIPYNTMFLSKTGPTDEDVRRGEELASLYGWE
jgi:Protein of unknown function (DUF4065)